MKVLLLGPANVIHTQRWVEALAKRGIELALVTQHPAEDWTAPGGVTVHTLPFRGNSGYFANALALGRIVRRMRPDLVNAHYASGYGTTAALVNYRPTLLSVWGSDVFDFPYQSRIAGRLIRWNLRRAQKVASTSHVMATQVRRLVPELGAIAVTPFGVDSSRFRPEAGDRDGDLCTIGTVKTLDHKYGIDVLIKAFARLSHDPDLQARGLARQLRLLLVGGGPQRDSLESLAGALGVSDRTRFVGRVAHREVPAWLNRLDIYAASSRLDSESFGVAVIEASSCGLPVVVSDVGGLPEVVKPEATGLIVPRNDDGALYAALKRLVVDADLRHRMGAAGRQLVHTEYEWERCIDRMLACYVELAKASAGR